MKKIININIVASIVLLYFLAGCKKQDDFLDAKPNDALAVPSTLSDCELLLHDEDILNKFDPALGQIGTDDYYLGSSEWLSLPTMQERNGYIWAKDIYAAGTSVVINDWSVPYQRVYYANVVLETLDKIGASDPSYSTRLRGQALFYRSIAFYDLLQTFSAPYDFTSSTQLGIPIRLSSDINIKSVRATEKECYAQIIKDMQTAQPLLPTTSDFITRPTKAAGYALMARLYLSIGNYDQAYKYSDSCLALNSSLTDFNTLPASSFTLTTNNLYPLAEDIYHSTLTNYQALAFTRAAVDSTLYQSYEDNDLRKKVFFTLYNGKIRFKGSYEFKNFGYSYSGLATDEMFLIRAESAARSGNYQKGMDDLNTLLAMRYATNTFTPRTAIDANDALAQILKERRKELLFRGLRWSDLRRLNREAGFAVSLARSVDGNAYSLPPNDPRYTMPIPQSEIVLSGIQQNSR